LKNNWILSSDSILRIYYENNGCTYFHSGNTGGTEGFKFRNTAQADIVTITDAGNISTTGTLTSSGAIYANGNSLIFPNTLSDFKISLWGPNSYGFGVQSSELKYTSGGVHKFYTGTTNTFGIDSSGNITNTGAITNGSTSYINAGTLRLGGWDTGNTVYNGSKSMGITVDSGYSITIGQNGGVGAALVVNNSGITISQPTTINNSLTIYGNSSTSGTATVNSLNCTNILSADTFKTNSAYNNNIVLNSFNIYPQLSGSGGYYYIDVQNYAVQGWCYLQLSVSSTNFYWMGRVLVASIGGVYFTNDWFNACSTSFTTYLGRLTIVITPSTGPSNFQIMYTRIIG